LVLVLPALPDAVPLAPVDPEVTPVPDLAAVEPEPLEPELAVPEPAPVEDEPPEPVDELCESSAAVSAVSSAATVLMSPANAVCAPEAALNASVQVSAVGGVVVDVVLEVVSDADVAADVDGAVHTEVAVARAELAAAESASSCLWAATNLDWSWATEELPVPPLDVPPPELPPPGVAEDPAESEVMTLVNVASVVVDAVWLASSLASVAWAEARLA